LKFKDFYDFRRSAKHQVIQDSLINKSTPYFIQYNIESSFDENKPVYFPFTDYKDVFQQLKITTSISQQGNIKEIKKFPVIIYHHGSQSNALDNHIMAEYFASHGYIFMAIQGHLPYPNKVYGDVAQGESFYDLQAIKQVIAFVKSSFPGEKCFFAGHSFGAQLGWLLIKETLAIDGFISMETTIETKTDSMEVKLKWPDFYESILLMKGRLQTPILSLAYTYEESAFKFFKNKSVLQYNVTPRQYIDHDAFTSAWFLRLALDHEMEIPGKRNLTLQYNIYLKQLKLMHSFLESLSNKKGLNTESFENDFYFFQ
jgi:pimeloyl-ACP methyl ester carboxylesterase